MSFKWENAFSKTLLSCVALLGLSTELGAAQDGKTYREKQNFAFAYPKDLNLSNPYDYYFYVEGLAFQGMETGLDFVIKETPSIASARMAGFGLNQSWDYNFGTRIGWGLYLDHDAWNLDFDWLWVNVTNSQSIQADGGATLPILLPDNGNGTSSYSTFGSAGGNWGCTVNVFDATLGKPYHISRKVIFNPHFGIRFAWIDQELGVDYGGTAPANAIKFNAENDFWGIGARMGVDTDWVLGYGFKLFSNLSSSILAGWFDTSQTFRLPGIGQPVNLSDDPQMVVPNLELAAGFDWGTTFADCAYYLNIRAGYEFQVWWNQWNSRQFVTGAFDGNFNNVPNRGDLTLNGFTLKVQLDI